MENNHQDGSRYAVNQAANLEDEHQMEPGANGISQSPIFAMKMMTNMEENVDDDVFQPNNITQNASVIVVTPQQKVDYAVT